MPSISLYLNKNKPRKDNSYPLSLRVTVGAERRYISISDDERFSAKESQITQSGELKSNHPQFARINNLIAERKKEFSEAILEFEKFKGGKYKIDELIKKVIEDVDPRNIIDYFKIVEKEFKKKGKLRTYESYKGTSHILGRFLSSEYNKESERLKNKPKEKATFPKKDDVPFSEITSKRLQEFVEFLENRGVADTTKSHYFRNIRSVFNRAIANGHASAGDYPFSRNKYDKKFSLSQFDKQTKRRAIDKKDLLKLFKLSVSDEDFYCMLAKQYAEFSYYGRGMNFIDFSYLKWSDIRSKRIVYKRHKTGKTLSISIEDEMNSILDYWKPTNGHNDDYIFPILNPEIHKSLVQQDNRIKKVRKEVNTKLKAMAKKVGIEENLTTYSIRHTFATTLKYSGVPISKIREMLQHSSDQVTETYLKSFDDEVLDKEISNLR